MKRQDAARFLVVSTLTLLAAGSSPAWAAAERPTPEPQQTGRAATVRMIAQPQYDEVLDATFSAGVAPDGSAYTEVRSGDLKVEKWATAAGHATIVLSSKKDRVTIRMTDTGYTVSRGKRSASVSPSEQSEDRRTAVRSVLLGSPAVRAFRAFTAALERRSGDDSPVMISTMMDGAIAAMLDGDEAAIERVGRRVTRALRAGLRQAQGPMPAQFNDCLGLYEQALMWAWNTYMGCMGSSWWDYYFSNWFCGLEFMIRSQQYIWQFISCFAI